MGKKISSSIADLYNNAPPPNIEGVQYSETPDEEKIRLDREALRAQPPSLVSAPTYVPPEDTLRPTPGTLNIPVREDQAISDASTPPALIEGVVGYEGEGAEGGSVVAKSVAGQALGAAAEVADIPADIGVGAYDFIAKSKPFEALGLSEYMKGYGIADKYREIFVDPARRTSMQLLQDNEVTSGSEKLLGALTGGLAGMGVQLTADKSLGAAIVSVITKRNPAVGAILLATKGAEQTRILADWVIGMSARSGLNEYANTNDLVAAGAAAVEAAAEGQVMHAIPTTPIKGAAGWAAFGVGSRFKEDLKRDELSSWDEYKFNTAESVGFHLAFMASNRMREFSQSPVERAYSESILRQLEEDGTVDMRKLDYIVNSPESNDAMREQAGRLKMVIADERSLYHPEDQTLKVSFDTAVKGEDGKPLQVYHGTNSVYTDPSNTIVADHSLYGPGHYFTEDREIANEYAMTERATLVPASERPYPHGNVRAAYLRIKHPMDMDAELGPRMEAVWKAVKGKLGGASDPPIYQTNGNIYDWLSKSGASKELLNAELQKHGVDGLTHIGGSIQGEKSHRVWVALDAKNVLPGFSRPEWAFRGPDYNELGNVHKNAAHEIQAKIDAGELKQEDAQGDKSWKMFFQDAVNRLADQRGTVGPDIGPPPKPPEPPKETTDQYLARMDALLGRTKEDIWKARSEQRFSIGQKVKAHDRDNYGEITEERINPVTKEATYTVHFVSPKGDVADVPFTPEFLSPIGKDGKPRQTGPLDPNRPGRHVTDEHARNIVEALHALDQGRAFENIKNAGALNFDNLRGPQDSLAVLAQVHNVAEGQIDATREMGQSLSSIHRDAMGMSPTLDKIRTWYMGTKNLAQKITAARISLLFSATELARYKLKTFELDATPADAQALEEWAKIHQDMQMMVEGSISNIARGLGALRIKVEPKDIMGASSPEEVIKIMSRHKAGISNRIIAGWLEMYKGWMFSNPGTHVMNTAGNFAVQIGNTAEDYIAASIGSMHPPSVKDRVTFKEANAKLAGRILGWQLSNKFMVDLIHASSDVYQDAIVAGKSRIEAMRLAEDAVNLKGLAPYENKYNEDSRSFTSKSIFGPEDEKNLTFGALMGRRGLDAFGSLSRSPLVALGLEDNYFREISYTASISGIAIRESFKERMTDEQRKEFVSGFIKAHTMLLEGNLRTHTKGDQEQIEKYAKDGRFHEEAYNQAAKDVFAADFTAEGTKGAIPNLLEAGRLFLQKAPLMQVLWPTYKTPWHILHYITQRTPVLNALSHEYRADMAAGGRRRDIAISKMLYGSMLYTLGASLYLSGDLLPDTDNDLKGTSKTLGVKRDSFLLFGTSYQVGQADPFGSYMSLAARTLYALHNTVGISNSGDLNLFDQTYDVNGNLMKIPYVGNGGQGWKPAEAISYMLVAGSSLLFDKSVLRQVKDVMNIAAGAPGASKSGLQLLSRTGVGLTLPFNGALRFANGFVNPYLRDAEGFVDNYMAQLHPGAIPSLGFHGVKPQFDVFGVPIPSMQKWAGFIPQSRINPSRSPIRALMMKLELPIAELLDNEWRGLRLTEAQSLRLNQLVEETGIEQRLNAYIQTPPFKELKATPGSIGYMTQGSMILKLIRQARRVAHARLSEEERRDTGTSLIESAVEKKKNIRSDSPSKSAKGIGWDALSEKFMGE